MKKVLALILVLLSALVLVVPAYADESEIKDLYPYNDPLVLTGESQFNTNVGDSHWDVVFNGARYHIVRGNVRYLGLIEDANANGDIDLTEVPTLEWGSFGSLYINDSDEAAFLTGARTSYQNHHIYAYFNESDELVMFEDAVMTYNIINDSAEEDPALADWRLATEAEVADDLHTVANIRMILDTEDEDGYRIEPLKNLNFVNKDLEAEVEPSDRTILLDYNPDHLVIPAGWKVLTFGFLDRSGGGITAGTQDWIKSLPLAMISEETEPAEITYNTQDPIFVGLSAHDKDGSVPGVQMIIEFQTEFDLPNNISAQWISMFDEEGLIQDVTLKLDYTVEIYRDEELLQTIEFEYDADTAAYVPSAAVNVIDTSEFGAGFKALYKTTSPMDQEVVVEVDIAVGVVPPRFENVARRFHDEGKPFLDFIGTVLAKDGQNNDITEDVVASWPADFNPYNPQPGDYTITLTVTQEFHFEGTPDQDLKLFFEDFEVTSFITNSPAAPATTNVYVFTPELEDYPYPVAFGNAVFMEVDEEGNLVQGFDRSNWKVWNADNPDYDTAPTNIIDSNEKAKDWLDDVIAAGHYVVYAGSFITLEGMSAGDRARAIEIGDKVIEPAILGIPDEDHEITVSTTYTLSIDDKTAPTALVVHSTLVVEAGDYANPDAILLANVLAQDNYATPSMYVSDDGDLDLEEVGSYDVEVTVADDAGNETVVEFTVTVVAPAAKQSDVDALQDQIDDLEALVDALETSNDALQEELDELKTELEAQLAALEALLDSLQDDVDAIPTETGCGAMFSISNVALAFFGLLALSGLAFFFFKRKY